MNTRRNKIEQTVNHAVMQQIASGRITMRPRWHFVLITILTAIGAAASAVVAIYLANVVVFKLRLASSDRPMHGLRASLSYFSSHLPWLALLLSLVSIGILIWAIRKFDFSYHLGRWLLGALVVLSLVIGTALAFTHINDRLETFGPMRTIYGPMQHTQSHDKNTGRPQPDSGMMKNRSRQTKQK